MYWRAYARADRFLQPVLAGKNSKTCGARECQSKSKLNFPTDKSSPLQFADSEKPLKLRRRWQIIGEPNRPSATEWPCSAKSDWHEAGATTFVARALLSGANRRGTVASCAIQIRKTNERYRLGVHELLNVARFEALGTVVLLIVALCFPLALQLP